MVIYLDSALKIYESNIPLMDLVGLNFPCKLKAVKCRQKVHKVAKFIQRRFAATNKMGCPASPLSRFGVETVEFPITITL